MRCWRDNDLFKTVCMYLLEDDENWDILSDVVSYGRVLIPVANMSETIAIELGILSTYLRERATKATHERAMQVARKEMRKRLGARN